MLKTKKIKDRYSTDQVTNGAEELIAISEPYTLQVTIEGVADILFHRWNCETVEEKSKAAKGSETKKTDNVESYVYRIADNKHLALPGEYLRQSIIRAAKFKQDPRSPRKSAMDLYKAGVQSLTELADLGVKDWDYLDKRRVVIHGSAITRIRPALHKGWKATVQLLVVLPEYISSHDLVAVITNAGKLIGVGDFRPTYGRFVIQSWKIV